MIITKNNFFTKLSLVVLLSTSFGTIACSERVLSATSLSRLQTSAVVGVFVLATGLALLVKKINYRLDNITSNIPEHVRPPQEFRSLEQRLAERRRKHADEFKKAASFSLTNQCRWCFSSGT